METRLSSNRCSFVLPDSVAWSDETTRTTKNINAVDGKSQGKQRVFKFVAGLTQGTGG
jgi:hypothetical protein